MRKKTQGFTLIEVLIALVIVAIAFTALIKSNAQSIQQTRRIKEKTIAHWVLQQGITMLQLGLVSSEPNTTHATTMFGEKCYWRASIHATSSKHVQQLELHASSNIAGPFTDVLWGYRYAP